MVGSRQSRDATSGSGIVGGALSFAWKSQEQRRADRRKGLELKLAERREIHERQLATFVQIVAAYNGVKAIRRTLKSLGMKFREGALDSRQVDGFHSELSRLNEIQLVFEAMVRELGETDLFSPHTGPIIDELSAIADYLNRVLAVWEIHGEVVREGSPRQIVVDGLRDLIDTSTFKVEVVDRRRHLTEVMHENLFGLVSREKLDDLASLENNRISEGR